MEAQEKKRKGGGFASPTPSAQALFLAVHSPTRSAVSCSSIDAPTNSGSVRTNANLEPSGAMKMSPCIAAPSLKVTVPVQFALTVYVPVKRLLRKTSPLKLPESTPLTSPLPSKTSKPAKANGLCSSPLISTPFWANRYVPLSVASEHLALEAFSSLAYTAPTVVSRAAAPTTTRISAR